MKVGLPKSHKVANFTDITEQEAPESNRVYAGRPETGNIPVKISGRLSASDAVATFSRPVVGVGVERPCVGCGREGVP